MKIKYPLKNVYTYQVKEILSLFQADASKGLSKSQTEEHIKDFGANIYQTQLVSPNYGADL